MMNGFGVESIVAHDPMLLLLNLPLIPWLFNRHNAVTKIAHCIKSACSVCKLVNDGMSGQLKALWIIREIVQI